MTVRELIELLAQLDPDALVGVSVEGGPDYMAFTGVSDNENGIWICVAPEPKGVMS